MTIGSASPGIIGQQNQEMQTLLFKRNMRLQEQQQAEAKVSMRRAAAAPPPPEDSAVGRNLNAKA